MSDNIKWPNGHQRSLEGVRGENADGQIELVDPGPRVELEHDELAAIDPRQGVLPGVPGVRVGAAWCSRGEGEAMSMQQLELHLTKLEMRRGRRWSERDLDARESLRRRSWTIDTIRDRLLVIVQWLLADVIDGPNGEIDLGRGARARGARVMLAWIWMAFDAGSFGCWLSYDEWSSMLGCSRSTAQRYVRWLEERGLIRRIATWQPCRVGNEVVKGSADDRLLLRIGPELEQLSLLPFARPQVAIPRRRGFSRRIARKLAGVVRASARARGRRNTREAIVRRRSYAGLGPTVAVPSSAIARRPSSSTSAIAEGEMFASEHEARIGAELQDASAELVDRVAASSRSDESDREPPRDWDSAPPLSSAALQIGRAALSSSSTTSSSSSPTGCGAQPRQRAALPVLAPSTRVDGVVKKTNLSAAQPSARGLGRAALRAGEAAPRTPLVMTSSTSSSSSSPAARPLVAEARSDAAASRELSSAELAERWRQSTLARERSTSSTTARRAPGRASPRGGPHGRTFADAAAELARALDSIGDSGAAIAVRSELEQLELVAGDVAERPTSSERQRQRRFGR